MLCIALACTACSGRESGREGGRESAGGAALPNVVLILVDTLRADRLACYGYPRPTSPRIDALAAGGARFADATAQASWTLPSVVSLLTGRYVTSMRKRIPAGDVALAEVFRDAGYVTVGLVANSLLVGEGRFDRGFDRFHYVDTEGDREDGGAPPERDRLTDAVWTVLRKELGAPRAGRPPLLLYYHAMYPHSPYDHWSELDFVLPPDGAPPPAPPGWRERALEERGDPDAKTRWARELRELDLARGHYDHEVRATDDAVGRLVDGLREAGYLENAVLALVADHGEGLWDHAADLDGDALARARPDGFFYKRHGAQLYEEALRTPFILWGVGVPPGVVVETPVENVDLFPTLLELAGLELPAGVHGRSLVGAFTGTGPQRDALFSFARRRVCVREVATGLKLTLETAGQRSATGLFHLPTDPHERTDLRAERPSDVARLTERIERWLVEVPPDAEEPFDADDLERLRGLGYTEADIGAAVPGAAVPGEAVPGETAGDEAGGG